MGWLDWTSKLKSQLHLKPKLVNTDNAFFKLHYRVTFWLLIAFTSIVCLVDSFGDKISCTLSDPTDSRKQLEKFINTYCFILTTFTVSKYHGIAPNVSTAAHPGVGPVNEVDIRRNNGFYQWVPYCLFLQAILYYIPHWIWRLQEKGRLKTLAHEFEFSKVIKDKQALDGQKMKERVAKYGNWLPWLVVCEVLNLVNVIVQWALTNTFLAGSFLDLGSTWQDTYSDPHYNHLDVIFPKVAKCTFRKFGPSGSLQTHDSICVLCLNVVYEKVYLIYWYWLVILSILTIIALIHRLLSYIFYKTKVTYNAFFTKWEITSTLDPEALLVIFTEMSYSEWSFFRSLLINVDQKIAEDLVNNMAKSIQNNAGESNFRYLPIPDLSSNEKDYRNRETLPKRDI